MVKNTAGRAKTVFEFGPQKVAHGNGHNFGTVAPFETNKTALKSSGCALHNAGTCSVNAGLAMDPKIE